MKRALLFLARYLYAAVSSLYLFTLGTVFAKNRALITDISARFGFTTDPKPDAIIIDADISEVIKSNPLIRVLEPAAVDGNVTVVELVVLNQVVKCAVRSRIFEFGTFDGRTTLNMAANMPSGAKVYTIDLPREGMKSSALPLMRGEKAYIDKEISGSRYRGRPEEAGICQLHGDTATFDFSPYYNTVDMVFIDASHSYEYVKNDTKLALKLLKDGKGIILWHDYDEWRGVTLALNEFYLSAAEFSSMRRIKGTSLVCLLLG